MDQNENFTIVNDRISRIHEAVETSKEFANLRHDLVKMRHALSHLDLHPNALRKFHGWLNKLFFTVNQNEKEYVLATLEHVNHELKNIEHNIAQKYDIHSIRGKCNHIKKWCLINQNILNRKPDKKHVIFQKELNSIKKIMEEQARRIEKIQGQRNQHFHQQFYDFESDLSAAEVKLSELNAGSAKEQSKAMFDLFKGLQQRMWKFPEKKKGKYKDRIESLFEQLKAIGREMYNAQIQAESQENQRRYENVLDDIEDRLSPDIISKDKLRQIRNIIFEKAWHPLSEQENRRFKIVLIRQHRDNIFCRMRELLEQVDEKHKDNAGFISQCRENSLHMSASIEKLHSSFERYRDEYDNGTSMKKGDLLRSIGGIAEEIKKYHRQLKTGHYFAKDKHKFREILGDLWSDVDSLIQKIAEPEWSFEWLNEKIRKNKNLNSAMLQFINGIPNPN
jgi:hypothetical protein